MCKPQCLLAYLLLAITYVKSWEIAITTGDKLEFYDDGNTTMTIQERSRHLTALAYDAVHNMLLFVDRQDDNASIFSYDLDSNILLSLVGKRAHENIQGVAFDPVTVKLFWTDENEKAIYWKSLKPEDKDVVYGNVLLKFDEELPKAIVVDSCRGYIYWTNMRLWKATIERARLDGSERQVIVNTDLFLPRSLAIDQRSKKLFWADDKEGISYAIESSDLDGKNRTPLIKDIHHLPLSITVSKDNVYWIDMGFSTVWKLPKNSHSFADVKPTKVFKFSEIPFDIVANYPIAEQTAGVEECKEFAGLSLNQSAINYSFNIPTGTGVHCLHGVNTKIDGKTTCKCTPGFFGERCETWVCQNYCLQGTCSVSDDGQPQCSCGNGFKGERCEFAMCNGYCLNNGKCQIKEQSPVCQCPSGYEGERCDRLIPSPTETPVTESHNCTKETIQSTVQESRPTTSESLSVNDGEFVETCVDGWDPIRDPVMMVLGTLCGLLCVACAVLITKILHLRRRPRIKKRIIVNKNVTPLTARPDQCEITIENCCNMNICETPCFEPRSTIRPTLKDAKTGKEEKKNLIANMELPDDY